MFGIYGKWVEGGCFELRDDVWCMESRWKEAVLSEGEKMFGVWKADGKRQF